METKANDRIQPIVVEESVDKHRGIPDTMFNRVLEHGLTKREYFAAMAMQGWVAYTGKIDNEDKTITGMAKASVIMADALIKQLNR